MLQFYLEIKALVTHSLMHIVKPKIPGKLIVVKSDAYELTSIQSESLYYIP